MMPFFVDTVAALWDLSTNLFKVFTGLPGSPAVVEEPCAETTEESLCELCEEKTGTLTELQRKLFEHWVRCPTLPQRLINRCSILLALDESKPKYQIARELQKDIKTIRKWAKRWQTLNTELSRLETSSMKHRDYCRKILEALSDATRSGGPMVFSAEQVVHLVALACEVKDGADESTSHWTRSDIAAALAQRGIVDKISSSSVDRFLAQAQIKPHKSRYWLNANPEDPDQFDQQVRVICCLYQEAPVLHQKGIHLISTDEKTGIQALQRLHPTRPAIPGTAKPKGELREQDYIRHGALCLSR